MKRTLSSSGRDTVLLAAGTALIAGTYGLVRFAYGLFLPDVQDSLGLGATAAGYVSSAASVAYCLGALAGLLAAGRPRALVLAALATGAGGAALMAAAPGTAVFVPAAVVSSAGAGLASPALVAVVQRNLAAEREPRGQAVVNAGTGPGLVAAGLLALVLPSWRAGFAVAATFTATAALAVLLLDRPVVRASHESAAGTHDRVGRKLAALGVPALAAVTMGAASAVVWTYGRTHLVEHGTGDRASTLAWVALGAGGTATIITARAMSALSPARAWLVSAAGVAASIGALGLLAQPLGLALLACAVFGWAYVAASSALIAWVSDVSPADAARGTSVLFVMLVLGQAAGSSLAGVVAERHGLATAFGLAAAGALVAASCGLVRTREPAATRG